MSNSTSTNSFVLDVRDTKTDAIVANRQPTISVQQRLAIVAHAPTADDHAEGAPFGGSVGRLLFGPLGRAGIAKGCCFLGYLSNEVGASGSVVDPTLLQELEAFQPNCILTLGPKPLQFFLQDAKAKPSEWRGSILTTTRLSRPCKFVPAWHPLDVFKQWDEYRLFLFDLSRAAEECAFPELRLPERTYDLSTCFERTKLNLLSLQEGQLLSLDIEGGVRGMTCISFATSPYNAFIVPWNVFTLEQQTQLAPLLAAVLGNPRIPKVLQNSLYDNFVLSYAYKMPIRGVVHDTMLSAWEIYPELPKALGVQASIWTKEPYYKFNRKSDDPETLWRYCCTDSAVTAEICERHLLSMDGAARRHYDFNVSLLEPTLYMELKGIRYDKKAADDEAAKIYAEQATLQELINKRAGLPLNLNSPKQMVDVLYNKLGYTKQHPIDPATRRPDKSKLTSNVDAILELMKTSPDDAFLEAILRWRSLDKLRVAVTTGLDPDGRIRCAYNIVGTETGRYTCYESPTGSGFNLQTVTSELRKLFLADPGYYFFQLDLAGADGWTVAAHCKRLGDPTMYDDYMFGIKPAKVIALLYRHGLVVNTWTREEIHKACKDITESGPDGWLYFACKRVQHGTNYGLGKARMADQILKDSYKKQHKTIYVSPADCVRLQHLYLARYNGVARWQLWVREQVKVGEMTCASGHRRKFFGRYDAHTTYMAALAHEPQANTTYATSKALSSLWSDPENRDEKGRLIIQPLHQVHDALCGQFPTHLVDWASARLRSYFNNPLEIAGQNITIPYDGGYGPSWGYCKQPL
jgi:uracil-DNA glycosylase